MRRKVLFVVLVVALAGCGEQKYSVWKVGGRPADRVAVEKGLDRAACELVLARLEKKQKDADDLMHSLRLQAARAGIKSDMPGPRDRSLLLRARLTTFPEACGGHPDNVVNLN